MAVDWQAARHEYVTSEVTHEALAESLGCARETVSRRVKKENWDDQRSHYRHQVITKTVETASTTTAEAAARHIRTAQALLAKGMEALEGLLATELSVSEIRMYIVAAAELERKALGMEEVSRVDVIHHSPPAEPPREALELLRDELDRTLN